MQDITPSAIASVPTNVKNDSFSLFFKSLKLLINVYIVVISLDIYFVYLVFKISEDVLDCGSMIF